MNPRLAGKVALVTGGSAGIGRATVLAFAQEGATVVIGDVQAEAGTEVARQICQQGGTATFIRCDVSQAAEVAALVDGTVAAYGRLDCAANNAGVEGCLAPTAECDEKNWDRVIDINLKGVWLCMRAELHQMLKQGGGAIVNVASVAGMVAEVGRPAYAAAKGGVIALTRTTAVEYAALNVRVNAVCPGAVDTSMLDRALDEKDFSHVSIPYDAYDRMRCSPCSAR